MPDSSSDWEAFGRLKQRSDHVWLELEDAPALTDAHVRELREICEELSRILRRCAALDTPDTAPAG